MEIATPWTYEGTNGSAPITGYQKKARKYQPLIAKIEERKPPIRWNRERSLFSRWELY
jgi:hypothetical protein